MNQLRVIGRFNFDFFRLIFLKNRFIEGNEGERVILENLDIFLASVRIKIMVVIMRGVEVGRRILPLLSDERAG